MRTTANLKQDPRTGIYSYRKTVPDELVPIIGKGSLWRSLGTRDKGEANRKAAHAEREISARLDAARERLAQEAPAAPMRHAGSSTRRPSWPLHAT